jgi:hypothetical protein
VRRLADRHSPHQRGSSKACAEQGMVTAETAVVIPVLAFLLVLLLGVVGHAVDYMRAIDAARSAARLAARGEPSDDVQRQALSEAPDGSTFQIQQVGEQIRVTVVAPGRQLLGPITLPPATAVAVTVAETDQLP